MKAFAKAVKANKKGRKPVDEEVYTAISCGVAGRGLTFLGFLSRGRAIDSARKHYEAELARVHLALEALEANKVAIQYRRGLEVVTPKVAERQHIKNRASKASAA